MINFLRWFDCQDLTVFERMTVREYSIRSIAHQLRELDERELIHELAWANLQVQAMKQQGKKQVPVYSNFKKCFNKKKIENEILGINPTHIKFKKDSELIDLLKKANK